MRCAIVEWTSQNLHTCLVISNGIYASAVVVFTITALSLVEGGSIRTLDKCTHALSRPNDVRGTNLQFLSEFCRFSHFNDKRQTNMTF